VIRDILKYSSKTPLCRKEAGATVCLACRHYCRIPEGGSGRCLMRFNEGGELYAPRGYVSSLNADPIEKKPLFHFLPGSGTLSFGMLGCNFKCSYCQNWEISQTLKDPAAPARAQEIKAETLVSRALEEGLKILVSTYNEPGITPEWAKEIFFLARKRDPSFRTGFVSNGYLSPENVEFMGGDVDFIKIDLKSFEPEKFLRLTGGKLRGVLDSIKYVFSKGIHLELVTLLVPGFNDGEKELAGTAAFIKEVSPEIPWHITAYHPDYRMLEGKAAKREDIEKAVTAGRKAGLNYVYGGNVHSETLDTFCPACGDLLVKRGYMSVGEIRLRAENSEGYCPSCGKKIYGVYNSRGGSGSVIGK